MKKMYALLGALLITSSALNATYPCQRYARKLRSFLPGCCTRSCHEYDQAMEILETVIDMPATTPREIADRISKAVEFARLPSIYVKDGDTVLSIRYNQVKKCGAQCLNLALQKGDAGLVQLLVLVIGVSPMDRTAQHDNAFHALDAAKLDDAAKLSLRSILQNAQRGTSFAGANPEVRLIGGYIFNRVTAELISPEGYVVVPAPTNTAAARQESASEQFLRELGGLDAAPNTQPANSQEHAAMRVEEVVADWGGQETLPQTKLRRSSRAAAAQASERIKQQAGK